jgi:hypothetical protein
MWVKPRRGRNHRPRHDAAALDPDIDTQAINVSGVIFSHSAIVGREVTARSGASPRDWRVETFGESAVDRYEQITCFGALALVAPETCKADRGVQFEKLCALSSRNGHRLMITLLGGGSIARGVQQIASQPVQLGLVIPLIRGFDDLPNLDEAIQALMRPNADPWARPRSNCAEPLLEHTAPGKSLKHWPLQCHKQLPRH